jgi:hypothetical protein
MAFSHEDFSSMTSWGGGATRNPPDEYIFYAMFFSTHFGTEALLVVCNRGSKGNCCIVNDSYNSSEREISTNWYMDDFLKSIM